MYCDSRGVYSAGLSLRFSLSILKSSIATSGTLLWRLGRGDLPLFSFSGRWMTRLAFLFSTQHPLQDTARWGEHPRTRPGGLKPRKHLQERSWWRPRLFEQRLPTPRRVYFCVLDGVAGTDVRFTPHLVELLNANLLADAGLKHAGADAATNGFGRLLVR